MTLPTTGNPRSARRRVARTSSYVLAAVLGAVVIMCVVLGVIGAIARREPGPGQQMTGEGAAFWVAVLLLGAVALIAALGALGAARLLGSRVDATRVGAVVIAQIVTLVIAICLIWVTTHGLSRAPTAGTWIGLVLLALISLGLVVTNPGSSRTAA